MNTLQLQDIHTEGNSIYITGYPITGVLSLLGFVEDVVGQDSQHYFDKQFRYTTNGIHWSEWIGLTIHNITTLPINKSQIIQFELQYIKVQPIGSDVLKVNSVEIKYNYQKGYVAQQVFNKTIFKSFFESDDIEVLNWYINVLNKFYEQGLIPNYIERQQDSDKDLDFIQFWGSIAKFFAYYVVYSRQFRNFEKHHSLLVDFLKQRGLFISDKQTIEQLDILMKNFYQRIIQRGTNSISQYKQDVNQNDGELLDLIWHNIQQDEFIFNPRLPHHIGWNITNSSPLYKGLLLHDNANKLPEKQKYPKDITKYNTGIIVQDNVSYVSSEVDNNNVLKIENNTLKFDKIKVDSTLSYFLNFNVKLHGKITVKIKSYDKNKNVIDSYSYIDKSINNVFLNQVELYRDDCYLPVNLFLYNYRKKPFKYDRAQINQGNDLILHQNCVWVDIIIDVQGSGNFYNMRFIPLSTGYSHGLLQTNNVIDCFLINNNNYFTFSEIIGQIRKYLIPYSSHIFAINIADLLQDDIDSEEPIVPTRWIGGDGYCQKVGWRPINPVCETIETVWLPEEQTAYCQQQGGISIMAINDDFIVNSQS